MHLGLHECWSLSQLSEDRGGLHPEQVSSSSHSQHGETTSHPPSHSHLRTILSFQSHEAGKKRNTVPLWPGKFILSRLHHLRESSHYFSRQFMPLSLDKKLAHLPFYMMFVFLHIFLTCSQVVFDPTGLPLIGQACHCHKHIAAQHISQDCSIGCAVVP